jgi:peptidoglycan/LPS O-acetylase OafA/YrhL
MTITADATTVAARAQGATRLDALDGLRAIAVTWVAFYHYFYFWTSAGRGENLTAYDDAFAHLPLFSVGYLGVHLFFMISGFVILLTLEKTSGFGQFMIKRATRLLPPLFIFGTLTFVIVSLWGPEQLRVSVPEYLFSLLILPPNHVGLLLGNGNWQWLDGAYWSLWVEVKFYVLIGLIYYWKPDRAITLWTIFELGTIVLELLAMASGSGAVHMASGFLFQSYVPYFSFGIAAYMASTGRNTAQVRRLAGVAIAHIAFILSIQLYESVGADFHYMLQATLANIAVFAGFYLVAWRGKRPALLENPVMTHIGRGSYGVYLMHQNIGLTFLAMPIFSSAAAGLAGSIGIFILFIVLATISYERFERPVQRAVNGYFRRDPVRPYI